MAEIPKEDLDPGETFRNFTGTPKEHPDVENKKKEAPAEKADESAEKPAAKKAATKKKKV